jgi:hypothetical protein
MLLLFCLRRNASATRHFVKLYFLHVLFLGVVPCDAETRHWRRKNGSLIAAEEQVQVFRESMDTSREFTKRNLMMGQSNDDDRHDRDPDNLDPENPLTWYPTKAPITSSPTVSTANPTEKPVSTASPSRRPSRAPSRLPTAEPHSPTVPPTGNPTHNPSKVHVPTGNPTTIPSTSAPTRSTASPTVSVSPTCFIDTETGNFGDVLNLNANILGYVYEMETDPSSTASVSQDVIPSLEKQMLKFLIPNYFENYCGSGDNTSRYLALQKNFETGGTMMGISSFPADKVMTSGKFFFVSVIVSYY